MAAYTGATMVRTPTRRTLSARSAAGGAAPAGGRGALLHTGIGLAAIALVVVQLLVLYWPVVTVVGPVSWTDKVVHCLVFAVPTLVVGLALRRVTPVVLAFAVHAPVSEILQHVALPGRSGDPWDAVLDLVGVAVAAVVLVVWSRRVRW